jgi:hypothetical protein
MELFGPGDGYSGGVDALNDIFMRMLFKNQNFTASVLGILKDTIDCLEKESE